jgi:hypothetical protein
MEEIYKGYTIKIQQDQDPMNPRENDNMGKMVCFHGKYSLGDKTELKSNMFNGWDELAEHLKKECKAVLIFPLHLYDHSGVSIKIGSFIGLAQHAEWDSGRVGFIYTTKKAILEYYNVKRLSKIILEKAGNLLKAEVEEYNSYISGSIYQYSIENTRGEFIDSCGGYSDTEEALKDAKYSIDNLILQGEAKEKEMKRLIKIGV